MVRENKQQCWPCESYNLESQECHFCYCTGKFKELKLLPRLWTQSWFPGNHWLQWMEGQTLFHNRRICSFSSLLLSAANQGPLQKKTLSSGQRYKWDPGHQCLKITTTGQLRSKLRSETSSTALHHTEITTIMRVAKRGRNKNWLKNNTEVWNKEADI